MLCGILSRLLMVTLMQCNSESDFDAVASTHDLIHYVWLCHWFCGRHLSHACKLARLL